MDWSGKFVKKLSEPNIYNLKRIMYRFNAILHVIEL